MRAFSANKQQLNIAARLGNITHCANHGARVEPAPQAAAPQQNRILLRVYLLLRENRAVAMEHRARGGRRLGRQPERHAAEPARQRGIMPVLRRRHPPDGGQHAQPVIPLMLVAIKKEIAAQQQHFCPFDAIRIRQTGLPERQMGMMLQQFDGQGKGQVDNHWRVLQKQRREMKHKSLRHNDISPLQRHLQRMRRQLRHFDSGMRERRDIRRQQNDIEMLRQMPGKLPISNPRPRHLNVNRIRTNQNNRHRIRIALSLPKRLLLRLTGSERIA